jgi:hypothetical protein
MPQFKQWFQSSPKAGISHPASLTAKRLFIFVNMAWRRIDERGTEVSRRRYKPVHAMQQILRRGEA